MKYLILFSLLLIVTGCESYSPRKVTHFPTATIPKKEVVKTIPKETEFETLMRQHQNNKNKSDAEVLTYVLNENNPKDMRTAAIIENKSGCDIIVRLVGIKTNKIYNLPISRNSKNQFVIEKGSYTLKSEICGAKYYSQKNIIEPLILRLSR